MRRMQKFLCEIENYLLKNITQQRQLVILYLFITKLQKIIHIKNQYLQ